jgi:hypothetical protein
MKCPRLQGQEVNIQSDKQIDKIDTDPTNPISSYCSPHTAIWTYKRLTIIHIGYLHVPVLIRPSEICFMFSLTALNWDRYIHTSIADFSVWFWKINHLNHVKEDLSVIFPFELQLYQIIFEFVKKVHSSGSFSGKLHTRQNTVLWKTWRNWRKIRKTFTS